MKLSCHLVKDLLEVYRTEQCSEETKQLVEEHLKTCSDCHACYDALCEAAKETAQSQQAMEQQRAASFRMVRKKLNRKTILTVCFSAAAVIAAGVTAVCIMEGTQRTVVYQDNIRVVMENGALVTRLQGSRGSGLQAKRVTVEEGAAEKVCLFYSLSESVWDSVRTPDSVYWEETLCYADRGADDVDCVYYYTGSDAGLETMNRTELQTVIDNAVLLYEKGQQTTITEP